MGRQISHIPAINGMKEKIKNSRAPRPPARAGAAVRDGEERLRAILETAVEGIITIDEHGAIESFNPAAEKIFGYAAAEVAGKNVAALMPPPHHRRHDGHLENYRRTGRAKIIGRGRETFGRKKDGTVFPIDLAVSEVRLSDRRLFTGFVRDITERKRLEKEILEISEREQRRIGQDLHDGLCQHLAGIEMLAQVLAQKLAPKKSGDAAGRATEIARAVRAAIGQTRLLARGLSPVTLDSEGLMSALAELAVNTEKMFRVRCKFDCPKIVKSADHAAATHLFRIAQEAVSNAIKHGRAKTISILLRADASHLRLRVSDDGAGFPEKFSSGGMGLRIMQSRIGMIGGTLAIERNPGGGACVVFAAPAQREISHGSKK
jgi:PAS domain S-box-containing protein